MHRVGSPKHRYKCGTAHYGQSIQVQWVLCVCWHNTTIVAITVIVIVEGHWATRTTQINGCTGLVPEVLCMFRHQLCIERDIIAAFLLHQGYPLVQGLIVVMTLLVTIVVVILMLWAFKDGGNQSWYDLSLIQWVVSSPFAIGNVDNLTQHCSCWCSMHMTM